MILGLLGALCLLVGTLYLAPYHLRLPEFWESRFTATSIRWMLWGSGALLLVHAGFLSAVQQAPGLRTLRAAAGWIRERERVLVGSVRCCTPILAIAYAWLRFANNVEIEHASLSELVAGTAWAPFQYRALVPWIVAATDHLGLIEAGAHRAAFAVIEAGAAYLLVLAIERLLRLYYPRATSALVAPMVFVPLLFTLATPFRSNPYLYPYDTPAVLFMALGLLLLLQRRWWLFYPLFALATLNRETTCFLTVIYVLGSIGAEPWRRVAGHAAAQAAVWFALKLSLVALYPGIPIEDRGAEAFVAQPLFISMAHRNIAFLSQPLSYPYLVASLGGVWVALAFYGHAVPSRAVRRSLLVALPFVAAMAYVGLLAEIRIFSELIPLFTLGYVLMLQGLAARTDATEALKEAGIDKAALRGARRAPALAGTPG